MKRIFVILLIGFFAFKAIGQQSVDAGFFTGVGTYYGDMKDVNWGKSINPAFGAFARYNFNPRYGLRFSVLNGRIGADGTADLNFTTSPYQFKKSVMDVSLQFEFNFFKYIVGETETPYSTFVFAGVGMQMFSYSYDVIELDNTITFDGSEISPTIPFGLGFKWNIGKRIGLGLELGMRKSFTDKIDNLNDPLNTEVKIGEQTTHVYYTDQNHNNDWIAYTGVHLVYKLIYGNREWSFRTPKNKILDWGINNR